MCLGHAGTKSCGVAHRCDMVMEEDFRRQLADYCREHDRLMAEEVEEREMAERKLIYKTTTRPVPAPEVVDDPLHIDNENLLDAVAEAFAIERERTRAEWEAAIANVKQEVAELRGKV